MSALRYDLQREERRVRVALEGELDLSLATELRRVLHAELASPPPEVVVDLAKVSFVDSSILATLIEAYKLLSNKGTSLRVANCQPIVRDAFELARVGTILGLEGTADGER